MRGGGSLDDLGDRSLENVAGADLHRSSFPGFLCPSYQNN
jgi:hypothetical protein